MWNQLWAEGILLVRTYAFLGNKIWVLAMLLLLLSGVVVFQLWADITQMTCMSRPVDVASTSTDIRFSTSILGSRRRPLLPDDEDS